MNQNTVDLIEKRVIVCPHCRSQLLQKDQGLFCTNSECFHSKDPLGVIQGVVPVLVDFTKDTILDKKKLLSTLGESLIPRKDDRRNSLLRRVMWGGGGNTAKNIGQFLSSLPLERKSTVLIVGGGAIGRGTEELFSNANITTVSFDIYASANTNFVADGHDMPIADSSVDAVWIQAVLEHVMYPQQVVSEIYRVLAPGGLVYAETPFLQNVHEGAYDFTRFTESGHRLLFSKFAIIDSGPLNGIGSVLVWNLRYLFWGLTRSKKIATGIAFFFSWLRLFDFAVPKAANVDSASGVYFLGKKDLNYKFKAQDIIDHYKGMQK